MAPDESATSPRHGGKSRISNVQVPHVTHSRGKTELERFVADREIEYRRAFVSCQLEKTLDEHFAGREFRDRRVERWFVPGESF